MEGVVIKTRPPQYRLGRVCDSCARFLEFFGASLPSHFPPDISRKAL